MPVPIDLSIAIGEANELAIKGDFVKAQSLAMVCAERIVLLREAMTQFEALTTTAAVATSLKRCGNYEHAAPLFEQACEIAKAIAPSETYTIGDYLDLGDCYRELNRDKNALQAYQVAKTLSEKLLKSVFRVCDKH